jgi:hypothetical protein
MNLTLTDIALVGFGVLGWMLFRIERAIARLEASMARAVGRVESDVELIRDTVESIQSVAGDGKDTADALEAEVRLIRQEMTDIVSVLQEVRGDLQDRE